MNVTASLPPKKVKVWAFASVLVVAVACVACYQWAQSQGYELLGGGEACTTEAYIDATYEDLRAMGETPYCARQKASL